MKLDEAAVVDPQYAWNQQCHLGLNLMQRPQLVLQCTRLQISYIQWMVVKSYISW